MTEQATVFKKTIDARIRGRRITRSEEKYLGRVSLDDDTRQGLGTQNVGVFVGDCKGLGETVSFLKSLDEVSHDDLWIVVLATKGVNAAVYKMWYCPNTLLRIDPDSMDNLWSGQNIVFVTPEGLCGLRPEFLREQHSGKRIAGFLVVDLQCNLHKARGGERGGFGDWLDRLQEIAEFRNILRNDGCTPPLILLTQRSAKTINTDRMLSAYCLDAWWYLDGKSLSCEAATLAVAANLTLDTRAASQSCDVGESEQGSM